MRPLETWSRNSPHEVKDERVKIVLVVMNPGRTFLKFNFSLTVFGLPIVRANNFGTNGLDDFPVNYVSLTGRQVQFT